MPTASPPSHGNVRQIDERDEPRRAATIWTADRPSAGRRRVKGDHHLGQDGSFRRWYGSEHHCQDEGKRGRQPCQGSDGRPNAMHAHPAQDRARGMDAKTNKGGKPIAAPCPARRLGIGLGNPAAVTASLCADNPKAKIGLPEIMVGIFPGCGGTTRLVRKMGAMAPRRSCWRARLRSRKGASSRSDR